MLLKKSLLKRKAHRRKTQKVRQAELKTSLNLNPDEDVIIIEKSNTIKFLIKAAASCVRLVASIVIILLTFIGLLALIYPGPRHELVNILIEVWVEFQMLL